MLSVCLATLALLALASFPSSNKFRPLVVMTPLVILFGDKLLKWHCLSPIASLIAAVVILSPTLLTYFPRKGNNANHSTTTLNPIWETLSPREAEVVKMLLAGNTQEEIAQALGIKSSTVSTYRHRALDKLGLSSISEIDVYEDTNSNHLDPHAFTINPLIPWGILLSLATFSSLASIVQSLGLILPMVLCAIAVCSGATLLCNQSNASSANGLCMVSGISTAAVFRSVALGQLPFWLSLLIAFIPPAILLWRLNREGLELSPFPISDALAVFAIGSTVGLVTGPVSSDVVNVQLGGTFLINWQVMSLFESAISAGSLALLANMVVDGSYVLDGALDEKRAIHLLQSHGLSELESRILVLIAQGMQSDAIEKSLSVAHGTVNSSRLRGYRILGIHSRVELTKLLCLGNESTES